jgi:hypothetical protein
LLALAPRLVDPTTTRHKLRDGQVSGQKSRLVSAMATEGAFLATEIGAGLGWVVRRWWLGRSFMRSYQGKRVSGRRGNCPRMGTDFHGSEAGSGLGLGWRVSCRRFSTTENVEVHGIGRGDGASIHGWAWIYTDLKLGVVLAWGGVFRVEDFQPRKTWKCT